MHTYKHTHIHTHIQTYTHINAIYLNTHCANELTVVEVTCTRRSWPTNAVGMGSGCEAPPYLAEEVLEFNCCWRK